MSDGLPASQEDKSEVAAEHGIAKTVKIKEKFLVSFCNNGDRSRPMHGILDVDYTESCIENLSFEGLRLDSIDPLFGCMGMAIAGDEIYVALQSPEHSIAVLGRDLELKRILQNRSIADAHGLLIRDGQAYVVSTGRNCIVRLDLADTSKITLVYGESIPLDTEHINDICLHGDTVVACKFGPSRRMGGRLGSIFDVATGKTLFDGIIQPHSVTSFENELYVIESGTGNVLRLNEAVGPKTILALSGYGRGLAFTERSILVGRSDRRTVSRHAGSAAPYQLGRDDDRMSSSAGIFVYDKVAENAMFIDLSHVCSEIYQILRLE